MPAQILPSPIRLTWWVHLVIILSLLISPICHCFSFFVFITGTIRYCFLWHLGYLFVCHQIKYVSRSLYSECTILSFMHKAHLINIWCKKDGNNESITRVYSALEQVISNILMAEVSRRWDNDWFYISLELSKNFSYFIVAGNIFHIHIKVSSFPVCNISYMYLSL